MADEKKDPQTSFDRPEIDASEFNKLIDEQLGLRPEDVKVEDRKVEEVKKEPEIRAEEKEVPAKTSQVAELPAKEETDLERALKTIGRLETEVTDLRTRPAREAREPEKVEPSVEYEEILNVRLPKDHAKRPIKVTNKDLIELGWNDDPAKAIEALANAFYGFILETIPTMTRGLLKGETDAVERVRSRQGKFYEEFPDLKGMEDLIEVVEVKARSEGVAERLRGEEYSRELGKRTRERVAILRGMTSADYEASLKKPASLTPVRSSSRAVTTGGGVRSREVVQDQQTKEMNDLLDR